MKNLLCIVAALWLTAANPPALGQTPLGLMGVEAGQGGEGPEARQMSEQELQQLVRLLSNPALVEQLKHRLPGTADRQADDGFSLSGLKEHFQKNLLRARERAQEIAHALTTIFQSTRAVSNFWNESMASSDFLKSAIYVIIFLFGGFGLEWLYWSYLSATLKRIEFSKPDTYGGVLRLPYFERFCCSVALRCLPLAASGFLSGSNGPR